MFKQLLDTESLVAKLKIIANAEQNVVKPYGFISAARPLTLHIVHRSSHWTFQLSSTLWRLGTGLCRALPVV